MNSNKLQEHLDRADVRLAGRPDETARQAAYIEALARDGHDAATARKLSRAFQEMEALHGTDSMRRPLDMPG